MLLLLATLNVMASKNSIKTYVKNAYYHVYNRGVEKRVIFLDEQDYSVFLSYLQVYLLPKDEEGLRCILTSETSTPKEKNSALKQLQLKNYSNSIELLCYALMSNHFHLLIKQSDTTINYFMNSLGTRYSMYFNRKYKRTGVLFQDVYKAVLVASDEQLLHVSRYIHTNPTRALRLSPEQWSQAPFPCSLAEYIGKRQTSWINTTNILSYFSKTQKWNSYENFLFASNESIADPNLAIDFEID